jgi:hypothetical protein
MARDQANWRATRLPSLLAAAALLVACSMLIYQAVRESFPRIGLPSFREQPVPLPQMQLSEYEHELFSELQQWNRPSARDPDHGGRSRERRWRQLSDDGLELAHIVLQVLQPDGGYVYPIDGPMRRLEVLAKGGDQGAMCLMITLVDRIKSTAVTTAQRETARFWLQQGAQRGHPECQLQLGRRLLLGSGGFAKDPEQGLKLEFAARRNGYAHDLDGLISYFQSQWSSSPSELRRLYCWSWIEAQTRMSDRPRRMLESLRAEARRSDGSDLAKLAGALEQERFTLRDCVDMGSSR